MANLTSESILATMREFEEKFPPAPPNPLFGGLFRPMFAGERLFEAPPPPPKIQLSKECVELVGPEFSAKVNGWLIDRFGYRDDPFKDKAFLISGLGIVTSKRNIAMITNCVA